MARKTILRDGSDDFETAREMIAAAGQREQPSAPDLLAEVEYLRTKVENLQESMKDRTESERYWKTAAEKALIDLDRQHSLAGERETRLALLQNAWAEVREQRDALAEQLAERVRRHESDARDLEQLSVTVRDESRRAHEAELQVDALADALESALLDRDHFEGWTWEAIVHEIEVKPCMPEWQVEAVAALRKAGRI